MGQRQPGMRLGRLAARRLRVRTPRGLGADGDRRLSDVIEVVRLDEAHDETGHLGRTPRQGRQEHMIAGPCGDACPARWTTRQLWRQVAWHGAPGVTEACELVCDCRWPREMAQLMPGAPVVVRAGQRSVAMVEHPRHRKGSLALFRRHRHAVGQGAVWKWAALAEAGRHHPALGVREDVMATHADRTSARRRKRLTVPRPMPPAFDCWVSTYV